MRQTDRQTDLSSESNLRTVQIDPIEIPEVTTEQVLEAAKEIAENKVPGLGGIPYKDRRNSSTLVRCGVPQGSVLGPFLRIILYGRILKMQLSKGVTVIGFADDIGMTIVA